MKILIVEDEVMAAERLRDMILNHFPETALLGLLDSISTAVKWFSENEPPDLAFFDIQLADGLSFEIFAQCKVNCPVIFTTAFDEYALRAFKVNSIDYLLKPIDTDELKTAIEKYFSLYRSDNDPVTALSSQSVEEVLKLLTQQYKNRFIVKVGDHIKTIRADDILCFYSMAKASYIQTTHDRHYVIDQSLEQVETLVDPAAFFRVNRKFIIALNAISDIIAYTNSRLKVILQKTAEEDIIVSREKVKEFKQWLEGSNTKS